MARPRTRTQRDRKIIADAYVTILSEGDGYGGAPLMRELCNNWGLADYHELLRIVYEFYSREHIKKIKDENARVAKMGFYSGSKSHYRLHYDEPTLGSFVSTRNYRNKQQSIVRWSYDDRPFL